MCKTDELIKFMFRDYDRKKGKIGLLVGSTTMIFMVNSYIRMEE